MNTNDFIPTLTRVFSEIVDGVPASTPAYLLNRGDPGLLRSLDKLSAGAASAKATGGASIAAHVEHLRYGLSLMNRWTPGSNPWQGADWSAAWRQTAVDERKWQELRANLDGEAHRWQEKMRTPVDVDEEELNSIVGTIAHVAYHFGAIRQIDRTMRGPLDEEVRPA